MIDAAAGGALDRQSGAPAGRSALDTTRWWQWFVIAGCTLAALLIRLYYVDTTVIDGPIRGDAAAYFAYATNLAEHGVFSSAQPGAEILPDSYRDPAYPFLVSILMRLAGEGAWYPALLRVQAVLGAATVGLVLLFGRRWMSAPWLAAAGLLMALWPHSVTITSYILTETLAGFLSVAWLWLLSATGSRWQGALPSGVLAGAAGLTNAVLLPAGAVVALALWVTRKAGRKTVLALLAGSLLLPGAWAIRGMGLDTDGAVTSTSSGRASQNLVQGSWPEYHDSWRRCALGSTDACQIQKRIESEISQLHANPVGGLSVMMERMAANPSKYAAWYLSKPALLWGWAIRIGYGDVFVSPASNSPYYLNAFFRTTLAIAYGLNHWLFALSAAFCLGIAFRLRITVPDMVALAAFLLYVTGVYWMFQSEPRYAIPFRSLEILASISALMIMSGWVRARRQLAATQ